MVGSTNFHKVSTHLCDLTHAMCTNFVAKKQTFAPSIPLSPVTNSLKGDHLILQLEISFAFKNGTAYYRYIFLTGFFLKNVLFERSIHMRATSNSLFILLMPRTHCIIYYRWFTQYTADNCLHCLPCLLRLRESLRAVQGQFGRKQSKNPKWFYPQ